MSLNVWCFCILMSLTVSVFSVVHSSGVKRSAARDENETYMFADAAREESRKCAKTCPYKNHSESDIEEFDTVDDCPVKCHIEQCTKGCHLLEDALGSSCQIACNGTDDQLSASALHCVLGCNEALGQYFARLKALIGTPAAPALVADSLTATSLSLEWGGSPLPPAHGGRLLAQWRYEEHSAVWHFCRNHTWANDSSIVTVDGLHPYTKYRFRVAILLNCLHCEPIVSAPSVVISTLPAGPPASRPSRVIASAVGPSRVLVSWETGQFPNGPILSYVLQITARNATGYEYFAIKDISAQFRMHYIWTDLMPNNTYEVQVSMRNAQGEGPAAITSVTTLPVQENAAVEERPLLIFSSNNAVFRQSLDFLEDPYTLYSSADAEIRGTAVHVAKSLLFISDSDGYVRRKTIETNKVGDEDKSEIIINPSTVQFKAYDLSVDWLNDHLYILGQITHEGIEVWQIARSNLNGQAITVAIGGINLKPTQIEVDPYNGYIFWITAQGLFRLDLANVSNGVKHDTSPELILNRVDLHAFSLDSTRFRLLVPLHDNSTVISISLDGGGQENIRSNIRNSKFQNVTSLVYINERFYWITGNNIWAEEYHAGRRTYFHNSVPQQSQEYIKISALITSAQPTPVPVNPPIGAQALLGSQVAQISWHPPHTLATQGKGAWQRWTYEILLKDEFRNISHTRKFISGTDVTIENLHADTEYRLKVAAYTSTGKGPWSAEFFGRTLKIPEPNQQIDIFWSTEAGVLHSDVTGSHLNTIVSKSQLSENHVRDIAWFEDVLYLVLNTSRVYMYNMTSRKLDRYSDLESVGSIAVDWLGRKLYWANPNQQLISRGNLAGNSRESLPMLALARELNVDPVGGHIYYSTEHAVECATLHGEKKRTYYDVGYFSGKRVIGLTLDMAQRTVLWIIRSHEGSSLYTAPTADNVPYGTTPKISSVSLHGSAMQGPLCQFGGRLLWLRDENSAAMSDGSGNYTAIVSSPGLIGLHTVTVREPSTRIIKNHTGPLFVIPESVSANSIRVNGSWRSFMITWAPIKNINYGEIFYDVRVQTNLHENITAETKNNYVMYTSELPPYSHLDVSIRAFTIWGYSPKVRRNLHSPAAEPSVPRHVRVYLERVGDPILNEYERPFSSILRWDKPGQPNGPLLGYRVVCGFLEDGTNNTVCSPDGMRLPADQTELRLDNLLSNVTYYFQVQAFTEVGLGPLSELELLDTKDEVPIPKLLVVTDHSLVSLDFDIGRNKTIYTSSGSSVIQNAALLQRENLIFIANSHNEIIMIKEGKEQKLLALNSSVQSMTVDWVERVLFWSQLDEAGRGSKVFALDLNYANLKHPNPRAILTSTGLIGSLQVSPFTRMLFRIESSSDGFNHLLIPSSDGSRSFFKQGSINPYCNCTPNPLLSDIIALGLVTPETPEIYWLEKDTKNIMVTDFLGCICRIVVIASDATKISVDGVNIYWTDTAGNIHALTKSNRLTNVVVHQLQNMVSLGTQPYPPRKCLSPKRVPPLSPSMANRSSNSITLVMSKAEQHRGCFNVLPTVKYHILYQNYTNSESICDKNSSMRIESTVQQVEIGNLKPFKKYMFCVGVSNFYDDEDGRSVIYSEPAVHMTAPGAPSSPRNITAIVLSPNEALVYWLPPTTLNSHSIKYEVHWASKLNGPGVRTHGEQPIPDFTDMDDPSEMPLKTHLRQLSPNQTYAITVRALCEHSATSALYTDSTTVTITTYPDPENITLVQTTSTSLTVAWRGSNRHTMEYSKVGSDNWKIAQILDNTNVSDNKYIYSINELKPKTQYRLRLNLWYPEENFTNHIEHNDAYIWPLPLDNRFVFETLCDRPSVPGIPIIEHIGNNVYKVIWEPSLDNGSPLIAYSLEGLLGEYNIPHFDVTRNRRQVVLNTSIPQNDEENKDDVNNNWREFYNGTDNYWILSDLRPNMYTFRVRALNSYGWSDFSPASTPFDSSGATMLAQQHEKIVIILVISILIMVLVAVFFVYIFNRRSTRNKKFAQPHHMHSLAPSRGLDVELATLRELPRRCTFVHSTNALYSGEGPPTDAEIAMLPHISRDQITLVKFLGSGAFGEVFEGKAKLGGEIKVAVKTLRKGATEQEKMEFLQEARLMGNFKHRHILELLGVCLDNDPHFIIMELMEGGDLLSYLRNNRTSQTLGLNDLLGMCLDVAIGCAYLESMHFVHRDLACRNCLVSTNNPNGRVVKIGDFGLARDIYKNDYYRKEGEGLLPVRWMAPESLVDGVFSCQSDVWAFGVLCWEVLTYGQQPYPARTNLEVLHYVREGGRLSKPPICPEELHELMLSCWNHDAVKRPTFKECVHLLGQLKSPPLENDHKGSPVTPISSVENSQETLPLSNTDAPRYLELLSDEPSSPMSDGYETPIGRFGAERWRCSERGPLPARLTVVLPDSGPHSLDSLLPAAGTLQARRLLK